MTAPRDFYGHRTVTDFLISKGVGFHPQTVVLEVDDINDPQMPIPHSVALFGRNRPIFEYQTIEQIGEGEKGKLGRVIYVVWNPDTRAAKMSIFNTLGHFTATGEYSLTMKFKDDGCLDADEKATFEDVGIVGPPLPANIYDQIKIPEIQEDCVFALSVFHCIHEGYEVDEVSFSRQVRRATERKTGKKPSNHYSLRRIKRQRKQYPVSDSTSSAGSKHTKAEAHLVRGHFLTQPDNHPLPQFAGKTFWIPAHNRGAGTNEKKIIYRVEL